MLGRQFTWANSLPEPTYKKLDRVLMDIDWEHKFPMVTVRALERIEALSDHAPLLFSFGSPPRKSMNEFKFELGWMIRDDFYEMVKDIWVKPVGGQTSI